MERYRDSLVMREWEATLEKRSTLMNTSSQEMDDYLYMCVDRYTVGLTYIRLDATLMTTSLEEKDEYLTYLIVSINTISSLWYKQLNIFLHY